MGRRLENLEQFGIDVVLERRHGFRAGILRGILYALSFIYERLVQLRLYLYRKRVFRERALGCLVISIGNMTVGGTGKTPIVEKFARALQSGGRRVAILSRGYKSVPRKRSWLDRIKKTDVDPPRVVSDGKSLLLDSLTAGDEPYMLAHNLRDVIVLVDKDRLNIGSTWCWWIDRRHLATNSCSPAALCASRLAICGARATSSSPKIRANLIMHSFNASGVIIALPRSLSARI